MERSQRGRALAPRSRFGRARSAAVTLLVACAVGLATFVGGWAMQAASLPTPRRSPHATR
jgi:hypothetical protein